MSGVHVSVHHRILHPCEVTSCIYSKRKAWHLASEQACHSCGHMSTPTWSGGRVRVKVQVRVRVRVGPGLGL